MTIASAVIPANSLAAWLRGAGTPAKWKRGEELQPEQIVRLSISGGEIRAAVSKQVTAILAPVKARTEGSGQVNVYHRALLDVARRAGHAILHLTAVAPCVLRYQWEADGLKSKGEIKGKPLDLALDLNTIPGMHPGTALIYPAEILPLLKQHSARGEDIGIGLTKDGAKVAILPGGGEWTLINVPTLAYCPPPVDDVDYIWRGKVSHLRALISAAKAAKEPVYLTITGGAITMTAPDGSAWRLQ